MMRVRLDSESQRRLDVLRAYLHQGPEVAPSHVRDACLVGLLSRGVDDDLRDELARSDVDAAGDEVAFEVARRDGPVPERPESIARRTADLLLAFGLGAERTLDLYLAAIRVGLRRLDPERDFPVDKFPGLYSPPVGTAEVSR